MTKKYENNLPWYTIVYGIFLLAITSIYYRSLAMDETIYQTSVRAFKYYGWVIILCGIILTVWAYIRVKAISKIWFLLIVLFLNVFSIYFYYNLLKPMPSQFRFAITNKTGGELTELRAVGAEQIRLNNLGRNKKIKFSLNDYDKNHNIDLFCKVGNQVDTVNLAPGKGNGNGYFCAVELKMINGKLAKE